MIHCWGRNRPCCLPRPEVCVHFSEFLLDLSLYSNIIYFKALLQYQQLALDPTEAVFDCFLNKHSLCSTVYDMDVSFYLIENMSPTAHLVLTVYWYESLEDCCCCCCKNNNNNNKKTLWKRATKALIEKLHSSNTDCSSAKQHHVNLPLCSRMLHKFSAICVL